MKAMLTEFKEFLNKGNFIDLAVAVVIGGAVAGVVGAVVEGIINPLISAIFGKTDIAEVGSFEINEATFSIGIILQALIYFVAVCLVVFVMIKAYNRMMKREGPNKPAPAITNDLLTEIRDLLKAQQD